METFMQHLSVTDRQNLDPDYLVTSFPVEHAINALTLLVGWQEGHLACKKLSGGVLA